uniref:Uncharacterized protein n=1 Tax=Sphaerodactylus townsendi TaxID=933632 RepID=A0ACB8E6X9_9SAUR
MEVAELKLLVEEAQQHIGSYLEMLKHQLKSLSGKEEKPEMGTEANQFEREPGDGCSPNERKPTEINYDVEVKMLQKGDNQLEQELLPKEAKMKPVTTGTENAEMETEPQELVKEKFIIKKLEQQALTFKAQLKDLRNLHHQYEDLKKEVQLLQMQIKEKILVIEFGANILFLFCLTVVVKVETVRYWPDGIFANPGRLL